MAHSEQGKALDLVDGQFHLVDQPALRLFRVCADWQGGGFAYTLPFADATEAREWAQRKAATRPGAVITAVDRGPAPAELLQQEAEQIAAAVARNVSKGQRLAARNDAHALDLQVQFQGYIGGLDENSDPKPVSVAVFADKQIFAGTPEEFAAWCAAEETEEA